MNTTETVSINLKMGEEKILTFSSLATAGYLWQYDIKDASIIAVEKVDVKTNTDNPLLGASVDEVFKISTLKTGTTQLIFNQSRIWEKNIAPVKIKKYQISIQK